MAEDPEDQIRRRAFEIWQREGAPEGLDEQHWLQAEREIAEAEASSTVLPTESSRAARKEMPDDS